MPLEWGDKLKVWFVTYDGSASPDNLIYHYQSLISGLLASAAAFGTILYLHLQHRSDRTRKHESLRSVLPIAANEMHRYTDECFSTLRAILNRFDTDNTLTNETMPERIELPSNAVLKFQEAIQTSGQEGSEYLANFLNFCQVQNSRINSLIADFASEHGVNRVDFREQVYPHVLDAYVLRIANNQMFVYGRRRARGLSRSHTLQHAGTDEWHLERSFDNEVLDYIRDNIDRAAQYVFSPKRETVLSRVFKYIRLNDGSDKYHPD